MPNPRRLRRNDLVVLRNDPAGFWPGRIWRRLDENHVEVIDCGKKVIAYHEDDLELSDYKGRWDWCRDPDNNYGNTPRWRFMTSLRQLKKNASYYNAHFGGANHMGRRWTEEERAKALANPRFYQRPSH